MDGINTERYRHVMRPHTAAERAGLEESVAADGCREPLTVAVLAGERYLIDGYQRLAACEARGVTYEVSEIAFGSEEDLLAWMERHARGRRNQTRTERNYYIGCRYLREKGPVGRPPKTRSRGSNFDDTAKAIAQQERCGEAHVRRCAKLAAHLAELTVEALRPIKWVILSEQVKYGKAVVDEIVYLGAGSDEVKALLAEIAGGEPVPPKRVKELLGMASGADPADELDDARVVTQLERFADRLRRDAPERFRSMVNRVQAWVNGQRRAVEEV